MKKIVITSFTVFPHQLYVCISISNITFGNTLISDQHQSSSSTACFKVLWILQILLLKILEMIFSAIYIVLFTQFYPENFSNTYLKGFFVKEWHQTFFQNAHTTNVSDTIKFHWFLQRTFISNIEYEVLPLSGKINRSILLNFSDLLNPNLPIFVMYQVPVKKTTLKIAQKFF